MEEHFLARPSTSKVGTELKKDSTGYLTFETLITFLTIENLNS